MLGKLIKHEFKATARTFVPVYGATMIVALFTRFMMIFQDNSFASSSAYSLVLGASIFAFIALLIASCILTLVVMISRFYKNLLGEQGYLMLTLPVKPWEHIVSKLIVSAIWTVGSGIMAAASFLILMSYQGMLGDIFHLLGELFVVVTQNLTLNYAVIGLEVFVLMLVGMAFASLEVYFSIALGHRSHKNRVLAGFGWYILINMALQVIVAVVFSIMPDISGLFQASPSALVHVMLWIYIIGSAIPAAFFFYGTNRILTKKLNLE